MDYFPLFVKLKDWQILIVGGGTVALRKAQQLYKTGAHIHFVADSFNKECKQFIIDHDVSATSMPYASCYLDEVNLVIAATDNPATNVQVYNDAIERNILVNVVDDLEHCNFIFPSIVDRDPLFVAISTSGKAPALARQIRKQLEQYLPFHLGQLAELSGNFRQKVKDKLKLFTTRRFFWESLFNSDVSDLLAKGQTKLAQQSMADQLQHIAQQMAPQNETKYGEVYLVGAGPGNPDLLTIRALQLMQSADVVVYDRLVSAEILQLARRDARFICVAKEAGFHSVPQEQINQMLVTYAKEGLRVCRLKGGDPFIFGRGGEEVEQLVAHQIPFQIVPGITAASGCASYAGIPLTHRDYAQGVQFITGHCKADGQSLDYRKLVQTDQTLVIYMGLTQAQLIANKLMTHGRSPQTPIAFIENGTMNNQRVITATLATLSEVLIAQQVKSPTLLIIGEVVQLQKKLQWFFTK